MCILIAPVVPCHSLPTYLSANAHVDIRNTRRHRAASSKPCVLRVLTVEVEGACISTRSSIDCWRLASDTKYFMKHLNLFNRPNLSATPASSKIPSPQGYHHFNKGGVAAWHSYNEMQRRYFASWHCTSIGGFHLVFATRSPGKFPRGLCIHA